MTELARFDQQSRRARVVYTLWFVGSIVVGIVAHARGRSGIGYFLLSALLSPLIGAVLALGLPSKLPSGTTAALVPSAQTHGRCPACAEFVLPEARVCKHCGHALSPDPDFQIKAAAAKGAREREDTKNLLIGVGFIAGLIGFFVLLGKVFG
jgi:hypothetical protein